jgi:protein involved in polysaccharide export with SLBB domain
MDRSRRVGMPARRVGGRLAALGLMLAGGLGVGCASFSNPTLPDAIPVNRLPPEAFGPSREAEKTIPLTLLRQEQPKNYLLDAGDILGVFVEGVLGDRNQIPPIINIAVSLTGTPPPPAVGFPIPVQEDGTIALPLLKPIDVRGKNVTEVQAEITKQYVEGGVINAGARILVTLARQRQYHVTVIRQDAGTGGVTGAGVINSASGTSINSKRGTGYAVDLNAYENDVLNALARTGGLPGLDASSTIVIQRGAVGTIAPNAKVSEIAAATTQVRIPLRMRPTERLPFKPEDVILKTGDIIFIESRDTEVYYTGGVLPVAELILPRDYDLDVLGAVTESRGPLFNGGVNFNNLNGQIFASGLGQPSPSLLTIIRKTPKGGQITIRVDLNRAAQDRRERVLVQPGDFLILQESLGESFTRYMTQTFRFNFFVTLVRKSGLLLTTNPLIP